MASTCRIAEPSQLPMRGYPRSRISTAAGLRSLSKRRLGTFDITDDEGGLRVSRKSPVGRFTCPC